MNGKKVLVFLSVFSMILFVASMVALAGPKTELEWYVWGRPNELEVFKKQIALYENKNPDIKIELNVLGWDRYFNTLEIRMSGEEAPDIYRSVYSFTPRYVKAGQAVDLTPYLPKGYWERFGESFKYFCELSKDRPHALPQMTDTWYVAYNKDYFRMAGIEAPKSIDEAWSYYEWELMGRRLKRLTPAEYGFTGLLLNTNPWLIYSLGGGFVAMDGETINLDKPMVIEGLRWQKRMYDEKIEPLSSLFSSPDSPEILFSQGKVGMIVTGMFMVPWLDENIGDRFEWDATYLPKGPGDFGLGLGGCTLLASPQGEHVEEAVSFLIWLNDDEQQEAFCQQGFVPTSIPLQKTIKYRKYGEIYKIPVEEIQYIPPIIPVNYSLENYAALRLAHKEIMTDAMYGRISIEETIKELEEAVKENL